jgi:hypothetical protein
VPASIAAPATDEATLECQKAIAKGGEPVPACLGEAAVDIASEIVDAALGLTDE